MKFLEQVWDWFDGRKTKIGALVFFVATVFNQVGWVDATALDAWNKVAEVLVALGLGHKLAKKDF